ARVRPPRARPAPGADPRRVSRRRLTARRRTPRSTSAEPRHDSSFTLGFPAVLVWYQAFLSHKALTGGRKGQRSACPPGAGGANRVLGHPPGSFRFKSLEPTAPAGLFLGRNCPP